MDIPASPGHWIKRRIPIHPAFHHTDMMGVVHNAVYVQWFEEGRLEIVMEVLPMDEAMQLGIALPVVENLCQYHKPVRFGMPLELHTTHWVQTVYEGRLRFDHSLVHRTHKTEMASGHSVVTLFDMRAQRLVKDWPPDLWRRYQELK